MPQKPVIFLAFANDRVDDAAYLRNLPKELDGIRAALQPAVKAGLCELVERTNATIQHIIDLFQDEYYKDRIAIFHYGGHANGYQLLLEKLDGSHSAAHSEGLVSFFSKQRGLQLVFLNGCSSQQQALDLVQSGIPAVIGTSQSINDDVATKLAVRFYKGLAMGKALERSWLEAIDEVKIEKGTANMRDLFFEGLEEEESNVLPTIDRFPWEIYYKEGAEIIREWNLPEAVNNPLFGLPNLIPADLPEQPYRFLERYKRAHAEIFFGRSYFIRELFNRATDPNAAPIILFYGQSGVGKSSMLDAGLFPRLEQVCQVVYLRRDPEKGLLGTMANGLGTAIQLPHNRQQSAVQGLRNEIQQLTALMTHADEERRVNYEQLKIAAEQQLSTFEEAIEQPSPMVINSLAKAWKEQEAKTGQPLVVLLDQVEEIYTKPNAEIPHEIEEALTEVQNLFGNSKTRPQGKLILSYRKEYHPEIEEAFKKLQLPREKVFLRKLEKRDIEEVVNGLVSAKRLQRHYNISIEQDLPVVIADDLLEDKDSPIAPVLQILLTKMWQLAEQEELRYLSIKKYQQLKRQGILMDDFFHEQMTYIRQQYPDLEQSGLALDVLFFHTTKLGTANAHSVEELRERYGDRQQEIERLIREFKDVYLLADAGEKATGLAHDTLAPIVQDEFRHSDKPGQRAALVLENKAIAYEQNPSTVLDIDDLRLIEEGAAGMRIWTKKEEELIAKSRERRKKLVARNRRTRMALIALVLLVVSGFGIAYYSNQQVAQQQKELVGIQAKRADEAEKNTAKQKELTNQALASKAAEAKARKNAELQADTAKMQRSLAISARNDANTKAREAQVSALTARSREFRNDAAKALRFSQLAYALNPKNPSANLQRTLVEHALATDKQVLHSFKGKLIPPNATLPDGYERHSFSYKMLPNGKGVLVSDLEYPKAIYTMEGKLQQLLDIKRDQGFIGLSADGQKLLYRKGAEVEILSAKGQVLAILKGHENAVKSALFSPDNQRIVTLTGDFPIVAKVWTAEGKFLHDLEGHEYFISEAEFSPDGQYLATASLDQSIRIWKLDGSLVKTLKLQFPVGSISFSANGSLLVASGGTKLSIWDWQNKKPVTGFELDNEINEVQFGKRGNKDVLMVNYGNYLLSAWNLEGKNIAGLFSYSAKYEGLGFSTTHAMIKRHVEDEVELIQLQKPSFSVSFEEGFEQEELMQQAKVKALLGNLQQAQPMLHYKNSTTTIWNPRTNKESVLKRFTIVDSAQGIMHLFRRTEGPTFSPNRQVLAMVESDTIVRIVDLEAKEIARYTSTFGDVSTFFFKPNSQELLLMDRQKRKVYLWNYQSNKVRDFIAEETRILGIAFSPSGRYLLIESESTSKLLDLRTNRTTVLKDYSWMVDEKERIGNPFSPDETTVLLSKNGEEGDEYKVQVYDIPTGKSTFLEGHTFVVYKGVFSPDGQYILTLSHDKTVRLWNGKGEIIATYPIQNEFEQSSNDSYFLPNAKYLVIQDDKTTIYPTPTTIYEWMKTSSLPPLDAKEARLSGLDEASIQQFLKIAWLKE